MLLVPRGDPMIGTVRLALSAASSVLAPLLERDPEVYEARAVRRWSKKYVALMLMANKEQDENKKYRLMARALSARSALVHLPVAKETIESLDLAISLSGAQNVKAH